MKLILRVLSVSLLEANIFGLIIIGMICIVGVSVLNHDNYLQMYFDSLKESSTISQNYEVMSAKINSNEYVANGTIFIFWSIVGLLVYYLIYYFFISARTIELFIETLFTKGVDQIDLLEHAFAAMGIRVLALIGLLIEAVLFVQNLLPYSIATLSISELHDLFVNHSISLLWVIGGTFIFLHIGVVFLRCLLLRTRVFL